KRVLKTENKKRDKRAARTTLCGAPCLFSIIWYGSHISRVSAMSEIPFGSLQQHLIGEFSHTRLEKQPCKQCTYQTKCQQNPGTHQQQAGGLPNNHQNNRNNQEYCTLLGLLHTLCFRRSAN